MNGHVPDLYKKLFFQHYSTVVRKIRHLIDDVNAAEDLAQEVFLRLYRNPPDDLNSIGPWLHRVATRIAYDHLRRIIKDRELANKELVNISFQELTYPSNEQIVFQQMDQDEVNRILGMLTDRDRQALLLRHSGYSYAEISTILQVKREIVGTLLQRAAARFKKVAIKVEGGMDDGDQARFVDAAKSY